MAPMPHAQFQRRRCRQILELVSERPGHWTHMVINRNLDYRAIPCGRGMDVVVPIAEGLDAMRAAPCGRRGCCCTFDPLSVRDVAALGR